MRNIDFRSMKTRTLVLAILAMAATSCSRSLPTAPSTSDVGRVADERFSSKGLENQVAVTVAPGVNVARPEAAA